MLGTHTPPVGTRVMVLPDNEGDLPRLGTYVGSQPCPLLDGAPNPLIKLDSGDTLWGCECWWVESTRISNFEALEELIKAKERMEAAHPKPEQAS